MTLPFKRTVGQMGWLLGLCLAVSTAGIARADTTANEPTPPHSTFELRSASLSETRIINVYVPTALAGAARTPLPTLYMPDGGIQEDFVHVAQTIDSGIRAGEIVPLILIGIENTQRRRDLTGPTTVRSDLEIAPRVGGSAAFRQFLREELIPEIEKRYQVDERRGIIGESLAGLFILETLAVDPSLFNTYIALSPSLWWSDTATLQALITSARTWRAPLDLHFASANEDNIAPHVESLGQTLRTDGSPGLRWQVENHPGLSHATIYRALAPKLIRRAYGSGSR